MRQTFWITVDSTGKFAYVANAVSNNVSAYKIDVKTGALKAIRNSPFTTGVAPADITTAPMVRFAGTPRRPHCYQKSVSALSKQFGDLESTASVLGFSSVQVLEDAIRAFCAQ